MMNFDTSRFEFIPQVLPSSEIDSPYAGSNHPNAANKSKASDRTYPRRDELFQDEAGNLYLYKVINGVHKYVKIPADAASGSDNGDVVNQNIYMPYERLAKLSGQGIQSAVFEDGLIAAAVNDTLHFYKHNDTDKTLDELSNSTITLSEVQKPYFKNKFAAFTYKNSVENISFRIIIGFKYSGTTSTLQAFKLNSNLNSAVTKYTLESFGSSFSWNGTVYCPQVHILKDSGYGADLRIYAANALFKATVTDTNIAYDIDSITASASNLNERYAVSGNTNAILTKTIENSTTNLNLYTHGATGKVINPFGQDTPSENEYAILNIRRTNARVYTDGMYGIVAINDGVGKLFTTDFNNNPLITSFDGSFDEDETVLRVVDNSRILNHTNVQKGYEKIVMSFVVLTKKDEFYNAYLFYVVPNKAAVANNGTNANEPYEDSTYTVIRVGKYQFNGTEEVNKIQTDSYLYLLDNGNILENRSDSLVIYAASQFKYLSAAFADSLYAANLQAINADMNFADIDAISNKEMVSEKAVINSVESKKTISQALENNNLRAVAKDRAEAVKLNNYSIPDISGNTRYNLCKSAANINFVYDEFIISLSISTGRLYIYDITNDAQYERDVSFNDPRLVMPRILFTVNNGNIVINASKYGNLYGLVTVQNNTSSSTQYKTFIFYTNKTIKDIIEDDSNLVFDTIEDNSSIDTFTESLQLQNRKFYTRTGNSILQVYQYITTGKIAYVKETCVNIDRHGPNIVHENDVYTPTKDLVKTSLSFTSYWKYIAFEGYASDNAAYRILAGNAPGLVHNDYLFIPFAFEYNEYSNLSIIRVFRPSVKTNASSVYETVSIEYGELNHESRLFVKQEGFLYEGLKPAYTTDNTICVAAVSDNLVRYLDEDQNLVNVFFKARMDGNYNNIAYKELSQSLKDSITGSSLYNTDYAVIDNKIYQYASYRGMNLILRELNSTENNLIDLFNSDEGRYPSSGVFVWITPTYILYTKEDYSDSSIKFYKINHAFNTGSFQDVSASHADISNLDSGDIHTVKLSTNHILLDNLHLEARDSLVSEETFSVGERQSIIDSANSYIYRMTKGKVEHFSFEPNVTNLNYISGVDRTSLEYYYPIYKARNIGSFLFTRASYNSNTNTIRLDLFFNKTDWNEAPNDGIHSTNEADPIFTINLKPKAYSGIITKDFFNSISASDYDYEPDETNVAYTTFHMHQNNLLCNPVHDDNNGVTLLSGKTPDGADITLFTIKIGARKDSNSNVYVYFDSFKSFNDDISSIVTLMACNKPIVIKTTTSSWTVWNDDGNYTGPIPTTMAYKDDYGYCKLKTNINYVRYQKFLTKKIVYFPALIYTNANAYSAINAVMMVGIYNSTYNAISSWKSINLNNASDNNLIHGQDAGLYAGADDILLDNIPYITDTMVDKISYADSGVSREAYKLTIATNTISILDGMDMAQFTPNDNLYGIFKSAVQISRSTYYRNVQYQFTVLSGIIYTPHNDTVAVTTGSKNISTDAVLVPRHDEHKELYSSAKLLKYFGGVIVTNRLGPNPELEDNFVNANYAKYSSMFKPTFYVNINGSNDYYDLTGNWQGSINFYPIFYSSNKFRSNGNYALYNWNNTELLLSSLIKETFGDVQAYNLLVKNRSYYDSNYVLDLMQGFGYVKDSPGADNKVQISINCYKIVRNDKTIYIYAPLPKDYTDIPDDYDASSKKIYTRLLFSPLLDYKNGSLISPVLFATGCILLKSNSPVHSLGITRNGATTGNWLNFEHQYGSSIIYDTYSSNDSRKGLFKNYRLSNTTAGTTYGISLGYEPTFGEYFGNLVSILHIATDVRSMICIPVLNATTGANLNFLPVDFTGSTSAAHRVPNSSIYTTNNNYVELPYHNMIKYCDENQKDGKPILYIVTSSAVYAYDTNTTYTDGYFARLDISNLEIVSNNHIVVYTPDNSSISTPDFYEGSDAKAKYANIIITNTDDEDPSKCASIFRDVDLYLNGRQVVVKTGIDI